MGKKKIAAKAAEVAAEVNVEDVRREYYAHLDAGGDPATKWWWIRVQQVVSGKGQLIVDDDNGQLYRVEYTVTGDNIKFGDPVPVKIRYEDQPNVDQKTAASMYVEGMSVLGETDLIVYASREESRGEEEGDETEQVEAAAISDAAWDGSASRFTDEQYASSCVLDRADCSADWKNQTAKKRYSLPIREPGGMMNRNGVHAAAQRLKSTKACAAAKKNAAKKIKAAYAACKEDPPDDVTKMAASTTEEGGSMDDETRQLLAAKLGLPEDSTEEQIDAHLATLKASAAAPEGGEGGGSEGEGEGASSGEGDGDTDGDAGDGDGEGEGGGEGGGETQSATASASASANGGGNGSKPEIVQVDRGTWEEIQANAKLARDMHDESIRQQDARMLDEAIKAGKFPPSRRAHYEKLLAADHEGTLEMIKSLEAGIIPVGERGNSGGNEEVQAGQGNNGEGLPPEWFPETDHIRARAASERKRVFQAKEG